MHTPGNEEPDIKNVAEAARLLRRRGAKEVLITHSTHNTEAPAHDGNEIRTCPIKARNLSGRTGRWDTAFAGYITKRQRAGVEEALRCRAERRKTELLKQIRAGAYLKTLSTW